MSVNEQKTVETTATTTTPPPPQTVTAVPAAGPYNRHPLERGLRFPTPPVPQDRAPRFPRPLMQDRTSSSPLTPPQDCRPPRLPLPQHRTSIQSPSDRTSPSPPPPFDRTSPPSLDRTPPPLDRTPPPPLDRTSPPPLDRTPPSTDRTPPNRTRGSITEPTTPAECGREAGDGVEEDSGGGAEAGGSDDAEMLAKLRCPSESAEVVAEREKRRRRRRCPDYPGLALSSSVFSTETGMKFSIIRNELHNVLKPQLRRVSRRRRRRRPPDRLTLFAAQQSRVAQLTGPPSQPPPPPSVRSSSPPPVVAPTTTWNRGFSTFRRRFRPATGSPRRGTVPEPFATLSSFARPPSPSRARPSRFAATPSPPSSSSRLTTTGSGNLDV